jgi:DNA polymerase/3'-5' exonuclease PolX
MSMTERRPRLLAVRAADALLEALRPACARIEVAGSIRRGRPVVGDIEIVCIPLPTYNLLGEPTPITLVDHALTDLGVPFSKNGPAYKQFQFNYVHLLDNVGHAPGPLTFTVDLFLVTPETWGMQYIIRTGDADFSRLMVTPRFHNGLCPNHLHVGYGRLHHGDTVLETPEERDVFALYGLPYVEPAERCLATARRLVAHEPPARPEIDRDLHPA